MGDRSCLCSPHSSSSPPRQIPAGPGIGPRTLRPRRGHTTTQIQALARGGCSDEVHAGNRIADPGASATRSWSSSGWRCPGGPGQQLITNLWKSESFVRMMVKRLPGTTAHPAARGIPGRRSVIPAKAGIHFRCWSSLLDGPRLRGSGVAARFSGRHVFHLDRLHLRAPRPGHIDERSTPSIGTS